MISVLIGDDHEGKMIDHGHSYSLRTGGPSSVISRPVGWSTVKLVHAFLSCLMYGLSLMLMLIATTFNPCLFLALVIGSIIGEYVCCDFHIDHVMGVYKPLTQYGGTYGRIIRYLLCVRNADNSEDHELVVDAEDTRAEYEISSSVKSILWSLPRMISTILLVVVIVWVIQAEGAFGFDSISVFGWHALCMTLFVGVFMNEAVLTYKVPLLPQLANDRKYLRYVVLLL